MHPDCIFHVPLAESLDAAHAAGDPAAHADPKSDAPAFEDDDARPGARFGRDTCIHYAVEGNFRRERGTVMLWLKPDWPADFRDTLGRILWDLRIELGSIVPDDPSQRYAIVFPSPAGIGKAYEGRSDLTYKCWRFCIATNRNRYIIGTDQKRPDQRTRQAVFGTQQQFPADQWLHLAVAWTPDEGAIFVNGAQDARAPLPEGVPDKPLPPTMQLGAVSSWINAGVCGVLADFRIYSEALDTQTIRREAGIDT